MNISQYIDAISNIDLFNCFNKEELKNMFDSSKYRIVKYGKGETIHFQNEICNTLDIILKGKVAVQNIDEHGNVLTIDVFTERNIIGANLIFATSHYYPMTVYGVGESILLHIQKDLILKLCKKNMDFMINFLQTVSDRSAFLTGKINTISLKTIKQKLMDFLRYEQHIQNSNVIKLNITKKELAERLGIQRSSLSRELNKIRKDGLVEYDSKTITLKYP